MNNSNNQRAMPVIQILTSPDCSYCHAAKAMLQQHNVNFQEFDLQHSDEHAQKLLLKSGGRTLPQIFINDKPIGGFSELAEIFAQYNFNANQLANF